MDLPFVSVLVAARNEEHNLAQCLEALALTDYPKDKWEVWVGNDGSTDSTREIARQFVARYSNFHLVDIVETMGVAKGKANVLAHLAHLAKGDFFLITDADVCVPSTWVRAMVQRMQSGFGIVTGFTIARGEGISAKLQALDWLYAFSLIKTITDLGFPVTCAGNNMAISRQAYFATGGYEAIPFSVTEDYALFRQVVGRGYSVFNDDSLSVLAHTKAITGFANLLRQRKRWMIGAMQAPWHIKIILIIQTLFLPILLLVAMFSIRFSLWLWLVKWSWQSIYLIIRISKFRLWGLLPYLILHEFHILLLNLVLHIYVRTSRKVVWKGREYVNPQ